MREPGRRQGRRRQDRRRGILRVARALAVAVLAVAATSAGLVAAGFAVLGREGVWVAVVGPADQGPVDFASLRRRAQPTDSLACSPGACRAAADIALPLYRLPPDALMRALDEAALGPDVERVDGGRDPAYRRYVARTPAMRFPDTLDARAAAVAGGTALAVYGRSLIGVSDYGVNRARIEGWTGRLRASGAGAPP